MARILNREERRALKQHHISRLREQIAAIEVVRAPFKEAQEELTSRFNAAKADLGKGYTREYLQSLVDDTGATIRDLSRHEVQRFEDREDLALPVFGAQPDLFNGKAAAMPQEAKDDLEWEAEGYLAGRRATGERKPPEGCPPRMDQAWLRGWDRGQQENILLLDKGAKLAAEPKSGELAEDTSQEGQDGEADGDGDDETPSPPDEASVQAGAKKLRQSGWAEPTAGEANVGRKPVSTDHGAYRVLHVW